jgi:hypothetical protein
VIAQARSDDRIDDLGEAPRNLLGIALALDECQPESALTGNQ